jgi:hypothetical protein
MEESKGESPHKIHEKKKSGLDVLDYRLTQNKMF